MNIEGRRKSLDRHLAVTVEARPRCGQTHFSEVYCNTKARRASNLDGPFNADPTRDHSAVGASGAIAREGSVDAVNPPNVMAQLTAGLIARCEN